jgi:ferrous iron transport protein A
MTAHTLLAMAATQTATVVALDSPAGLPAEPGMLARLAELGFLPGETLTLLRRGPGGREPIAVQIGDTVFALRAVEAACVQVSAGMAE